MIKKYFYLSIRLKRKFHKNDLNVLDKKDENIFLDFIDKLSLEPYTDIEIFFEYVFKCSTSFINFLPYFCEFVKIKNPNSKSLYQDR